MVAALLLLRAAAAATPASFCDDDGWTEVWADHFNGTDLDTSSWTVDLNAGDSRVRDSQGTADNVYLEDGDLVLRSQEQSAGKWNYTSGAVQTMGKQSWKGLTRACVRARLPGGEGGEGPRKDSAGIWPAHWMMPDNKACCSQHRSKQHNHPKPSKHNEHMTEPWHAESQSSFDGWGELPHWRCGLGHLVFPRMGRLTPPPKPQAISRS